MIALFIGRTKNVKCIHCGHTRIVMREYRIFEQGKERMDIVACNQDHIDAWMQAQRREKQVA